MRIKGQVLLAIICSIILLGLGYHSMTTKVVIKPNIQTINMKEELKRLLGEVSYPRDLTQSEKGIEYFKKMLPYSKGTSLNNLKLSLSNEMLKTGKIDSALILLKEVESTGSVNTEMENALNKAFAITYLRMGETLNCQLNHNEQSCILPFSEKAVHIHPEGSSNAIPYLLKLLKGDSKDYISQWLLNIAYMTLGRYPQDVPKEYFIDLSKYDSDFQLPKFRDIAGLMGLNSNGRVGGTSIEDFNNDGNLDIFVTSNRLDDQVRLYINEGNGKFSDQTNQAGLTGITGGLNCTHADYNNDGWADIFIMRGGWLAGGGNHPNSLLRNNGDGTFTDVTGDAGLLSYHPTHTASFADFNNDGLLDLFVGNERGEWAALENGTLNESPMEDHYSELFRNNGDGTFSEVSKLAGVVINKWVKGAAWCDYDNDGRMDLYVSCFGSANLLFHNEGVGKEGITKFSEVASAAHVTEPINSFSVFFFDYNNDGYEDLLVPGYDVFDLQLTTEYLGIAPVKNPVKLYINQKNGTFRDLSVEAGLNRSVYSMGLNFGDIDNDGFLDFYAGTGYADFTGLFPDLMFRNNNGLNFQDVTASGGFGHLQKAHGIAFGDIDNDGDQDIYINVGGFYPGDSFWNILFENPGNNHHWITLILEGRKSNRSAIGARIKLIVNTNGGKHNIYNVVTTGGSYGASSLQQEIGLGDASSIDKLEIYWPASGVKQDFSDLEMNSFYRIVETQNTPEKLNRQKIAFNEASTMIMHHHH